MFQFMFRKYKYKYNLYRMEWEFVVPSLFIPLLSSSIYRMNILFKLRSVFDWKLNTNSNEQIHNDDVTSGFDTKTKLRVRNL